MNKKLLVICLVILLLVALVACDEDQTPSGTSGSSGSQNIVVNALESAISIHKDELNAYNFCTLFYIIEDGKSVTVTTDYIDKSGVPTDYGTGDVVCTYKGISAKVSVNVYKTVYELILSKKGIDLVEKEVATYDFKSLFSAYIDGKKQEITDDMVSTDVEAKIGTYTYSVTFHGITKTLTVAVSSDVEVRAYAETKTIDDRDILTYDYKKLFGISKSGKYVSVLDSYIDRSDLTIDGGTVTLTYEGKSASVRIIANVLKYNIVKVKDTFTVYKGIAKDYDYKGLFIAYVNGTHESLKDSDITSTVQDEAGTYTVTAKFVRATATINVVVTDNHVIEVFPATGNFVLTTDEISTHDFSKDFWLYVDEKDVDSKNLTIDTSSLSSAVEGDTKTITVSYTQDTTNFNKNFDVKIVAPTTPVVKTKNITTYPNSTPIDLTTLFEIEKDGTAVAVTSDMITGSVDYTVVGDNEITLTYEGNTYVATVTLKRGVSITPVKDEIEVVKGTDQSIYPFADDVVVLVNGIRYRDLERYIDYKSVDFSKAGSYQMTVSVPYGNAGTIESAVVNYKVVNNVYSVNLKSQSIVVKKGTTYDFTDNIDLNVNGYKQSFVKVKAYADDPLSTYYELSGTPSSFEDIGIYDVTVSLYVDGLTATPVNLTYRFTIVDDVTVTPIDQAIFTGTTLNPKDMFTIVDNGLVVYPDFSMIEGKVDVHTPGIYTVTISYKNITKSAKITIIDKNILGTYKTLLTTLSREAEVDDEGYTTIEQVSSRAIGDLVIKSEKDIILDGTKAEILGAKDQSTIYLKLGSNEYTLYYFDGIVVLNPDNSLKLQFYDGRRPMVYFNQNMWTITEKLTVNKGNSYVLQETYTRYSIDTFHIQSVQDNTTKWYALRTQLVEKTSADTIYSVTWGECTYSDGFDPKTTKRATLTFDGYSYTFDMSSSSTMVAKVDTTAETTQKYAGSVFTYKASGTEKWTLSFSNTEAITLKIATEEVLKEKSLSSMKSNAYFDYNQDIVFIYDYDEKTSTYYSYKFILDFDARTFTLETKDVLFGHYKYGDKYIFLDGYGKGHISYDSSTTASIDYERVGDEVVLTENGRQSTLYISPLLNVLTGKTFEDEALIGAQFVNTFVIDGAVVTMDSYSVSVGTTKEQLRSHITVKTKDGELNATEKKNAMNVKDININQSGFYFYTVKATVEGKTVEAYYAVEYKSKLYSSNPLVSDWGQGITDSATTLKIDEYGLCTLIYNGTTYTGDIIIDTTTNTSFVAKLHSPAEHYLSLKGTVISDGILSISGKGAATFNEVFTLGTVESIGVPATVIRKITVGGVSTYYLSSTTAALGENGTITCIVGTDITAKDTICQMTTASKTIVFKVVAWGDLGSGIILADKNIGTYTSPDGKTLILDGFGGGTIDGTVGTYILDRGDFITFYTDTTTTVYELDRKNNTYKVKNIALDETLVENTTYTATYTFVCGEASYSATTAFKFGKNKKVTVTSLSTSHDSESDGCETDKYSPLFASLQGVIGTYTVSGDILTVIVNSITFTFRIQDVTYPAQIISTSSTLDSLSHGYFSKNTLFTA